MYVGSFKNSRYEQYGDMRIVIPVNEKDEDYYLLNKNRKEKYVVLTSIYPPYQIMGCGTEGAFSFGDAYKVYFEDWVPEGAYNLEVPYSFDGKEFKKYYNVEALKYDAKIKMRDIIMLEDDEELIAKAKAYNKLAQAYEGDGSDFPVFSE